MAAWVLRFEPIPQGKHRLSANNKELNLIRDFLAHFRWELPEAHVPGITWLELLAEYEAYGYQLEVHSDDQTQGPHLTSPPASP